LTDAQKQQIEAVFSDASSKLDAARAQAGAGGQAAADKMRALGAEIRQKLADILSDDQRLQLRNILQNSPAPTTQPTGNGK